MPVPPLDIAVVGCGCAGAAAALFLHREGHRVTLFERAPAIAPVGAGLLLQPTGLAVLSALGVAERALTHGHPIKRLRSLTRGGRTLLDLRYEELGADVSGLGIHRASLIDTLLEGLRSEGMTPATGAEVRSAKHDARGLTLSIAEESGHNHDERFDFVVAADGARGTLRDTLRIPYRNRRYPWGALWAIAADPEPRFRDELYQVVRGARVMAGFLPTGHSRAMPRSAPTRASSTASPCKGTSLCARRFWTTGSATSARSRHAWRLSSNPSPASRISPSLTTTMFVCHAPMASTVWSSETRPMR